MKKVLLASILTSLLALPMLAAALPTSPLTIINSETALIDLIDRIGQIIFLVLMSLAAIFLVVAGFFFMTAGGNPENVNKARQMLINALIGVAIGLASKGLISLVENILRP